MRGSDLGWSGESAVWNGDAAARGVSRGFRCWGLECGACSVAQNRLQAVVRRSNLPGYVSISLDFGILQTDP